MEKIKRLKLEEKLIPLLYGKLQLLQRKQDRMEIVERALKELFTMDESGFFKKEKEELDLLEKRKEFLESFVSYGIIDDLLRDLDVEDVIINALNPIYIHHSGKGFVKTAKRFETIEELNIFIQKLVLLSGRRDIEKVMNIELPNLEGRVNFVRSPFGPQLTITKAKMLPLSIIEMINRGTLTFEVAAQLWLYLEGMSIRPANMLIAGGPGVGKTTLLNALFSFIPGNERLVVIEDTLELNTALEESCSRLESGDDFSLADLVKNSLRMRPERIVIGEVRGEEARDMMTAVNIGKYCIGTIHALTSREAIIRLQNEPMNIPEELIRLTDVFVVLKRYHAEGKVLRVVDEISETSGMEREKVLLSHIYKYDYESNTLKAVSSSTIYRDRLASEAGVSPKRIIQEVALRTILLQELAKRGHNSLTEVTAFCRAYNLNPKEAVHSLGLNYQQLLKER